MGIVIVGGGSTGSYLASVLSETASVCVIESNREAFRELRRAHPDVRVLLGSGTEARALEAAGIAEADTFIATTGDDEVNLVASMLAKMEYGCARTLAMVNDPRNAWMFTAQMGVDVGIDQAELIARFVQEGIDVRDVFTLMRVGKGDTAILQVKVGEGSRAAGRRLGEASLPADTLLVAIDRAGDAIIPNGDTVIQAGDEAIVVTPDVHRREVVSLLS